MIAAIFLIHSIISHPNYSYDGLTPLGAVALWFGFLLLIGTFIGAFIMNIEKIIAPIEALELMISDIGYWWRYRKIDKIVRDRKLRDQQL